MATATIRVKGLRELDRAFKSMDKELQRDLRTRLKKAAAPVVSSAQSKISRYQGASTGTIKPVALAKGVVVRQNAKKVTGKRGDFGALQMRLFLEALEENEDEVVRAVENLIDELADRNGF
jgi:hypothetical protein